MLANLGKKTPRNVAISLSRDNIPGLISNLTPNVIDEFDRKIKELSEQGKDMLYLFQIKIWMILLKL